MMPIKERKLLPHSDFVAIFGEPHSDFVAIFGDLKSIIQVSCF
jgi:hypothetical protein